VPVWHQTTEFCRVVEPTGSPNSHTTRACCRSSRLRICDLRGARCPVCARNRCVCTSHPGEEAAICSLASAAVLPPGPDPSPEPTVLPLACLPPHDPRVTHTGALWRSRNVAEKKKGEKKQTVAPLCARNSNANTTKRTKRRARPPVPSPLSPAISPYSHAAHSAAAGPAVHPGHSQVHPVSL
jgi:hypothetical protein